MRKERWADTRFEIDFPLPERVQRIVDELEQLDMEEHYGYFEDCGFIESFAKHYIGHGLTEEQYNILLLRYHGG